MLPALQSIAASISMSRHFILLVTAVWPCAAFADEPMDFKITHKKGDVVQAKVEKDRVVFDVQSPTGISQFDVKRLGEELAASSFGSHLKGARTYSRQPPARRSWPAAVSMQNVAA